MLARANQWRRQEFVRAGAQEGTVVWVPALGACARRTAFGRAEVRDGVERTVKCEKRVLH